MKRIAHPPGMKRCPRCQTEKPVAEFGGNRSRRDGLQVYCRECFNAYNRQYYEVPEHKAKAAATASANRNLERDRIKAKRHYWRHPELARGRRRAYYELNRTVEIERAIKYTRANPARVARYAIVRRNRRRSQVRRSGVLDVSARDWRRLCDRHGNACFYCGALAPLTQDHIVPISRGGRHSIGNLLPACRSCNSSKNNKLLIEWTRWRGHSETKE